MSDEGENTCPLCAEEMDLRDQQLRPCECGYDVLVSVERQRVAEKEEETQKKIAITEAEINAYDSKIVMEQKLMDKDNLRMQEEISNSIYIARQKSLADDKYYQDIWPNTKEVAGY